MHQQIITSVLTLTMSSSSESTVLSSRPLKSNTPQPRPLPARRVDILSSSVPPPSLDGWTALRLEHMLDVSLDVAIVLLSWWSRRDERWGWKGKNSSPHYTASQQHNVCQSVQYTTQTVWQHPKTLTKPCFFTTKNKQPKQRYTGRFTAVMSDTCSNIKSLIKKYTKQIKTNFSNWKCTKLQTIWLHLLFLWAAINCVPLKLCCFGSNYWEALTLDLTKNLAIFYDWL